MLYLLSFCFLVSLAQATIFVPQPLNTQIRESDGVILGHYLKSKYIKLENGKVATQMFFKVTQEIGLQSELFGMDEIIVHYPGGMLADIHTIVEGVPSFVPGEKVVLFIKGQNNRYWGMNLGFGTYKIVNYGKVTMLINYIFPQHPKVGQISLSDFEQAVKVVKGSSLKKVQTIEHMSRQIKAVQQSQRLPATDELSGQNRSLASASAEPENDPEHAAVNVMWLVGVLSLLGGLFRMYRRRSF